MMSQNEGGRSVAMEDDEPAVAGARGPRRALDEARLRQQAIGVKLRQLFDQVVNEPVPTDFLEILRRGDEKAQAADD
jgi:Anti-sigma factor NepR